MPVNPRMASQDFLSTLRRAKARILVESGSPFGCQILARFLGVLS